MTAHRHRQALACAATALLLATGTACGTQEASRADRSPTKSATSASPSTPTSSPSYSSAPLTSGSASAPSASGSASESATAPTTQAFTVPVYYLGDSKAGVRLFREFHRVQATSRTKLVRALREAVADSADDPDYRTGFPAGTKVASANAAGRLVTVDLLGKRLANRPKGMTRREAAQALNALVFTAGGVLQRNASVAFRVNGAPTKTVLGLPVGTSVERANPDKVKSTISVFSPAQGATVHSPFRVEGEAATFEANVVWELKKGSRIVRHGFTTARECCTLAPYAFTVKAPPGRYTLVVHDVDQSDGEGVGTGQDTKDVTVR